jgi:hypothetical protein
MRISRSGAFVLVAIGAFVALWVAAIVAVVLSPAKLDAILHAAPQGPQDRAIEAEVICEQFVSRRLKAPSSADFSWPHDTTISGSGDGPYTVIGWVDAQNSFGAKIRSNYACEVKATGRNWQRLSLSIDGR